MNRNELNQEVNRIKGFKPKHRVTVQKEETVRNLFYYLVLSKISARLVTQNDVERFLQENQSVSDTTARRMRQLVEEENAMHGKLPRSKT